MNARIHHYLPDGPALSAAGPYLSALGPYTEVPRRDASTAVFQVDS